MISGSDLESVTLGVELALDGTDRTGFHRLSEIITRCGCTAEHSAAGRHGSADWLLQSTTQKLTLEHVNPTGNK